jgi:hypothetical protein
VLIAQGPINSKHEQRKKHTNKIGVANQGNFCHFDNNRNEVSEKVQTIIW